MIIKNTVFVLGAGASKPYGFPVGQDLADTICAMMPKHDRRPNRPPADTQDMVALRSIADGLDGGALSNQIAADFAVRFRESGCLTIDEFVEPEGNHRFLPLAKTAVIRGLATCERDSSLLRQPPAQGEQKREDDWLSYLFRHMRTADYRDFGDNKVKVVSFNFDRSFERKLFLMARAAYGVDYRVASDIAAAVPLIHLHGQLGSPGWLVDGSGRQYSNTIDGTQFKTIYNSIRIVHEEIDQSKFDLAHQWLADAETICFLGFSFHPTNTRRLRLNDHLPKATIFGTALGLSDPEVDRARNRVKSPMTLWKDKDAYGLLREVTGVLTTEHG